MKQLRLSIMYILISATIMAEGEMLAAPEYSQPNAIPALGGVGNNLEALSISFEV